ncbi:MAG: hypothetical protein M3142_04900 [Bacteroidota bacterium]|nr:hypothetical protein [Bacteroidota bacterium]
MRDNLLASLFTDQKVAALNRKEVHQHLGYLSEIIAQEKIKSRKIQYLKWRAKVLKRLLDVTRPESMFLILFSCYF